VLLRVAKASAAEKGDEVKRRSAPWGDLSCRNGGFQWDISID